MNGDNLPDAVVANQLSSDVSVLLSSDGFLLKSAQRDFPVAREPTTLAIADMDQDGTPDLVVGSAQERVLTVLLNSGGSFPAELQRSFPLPSATAALAVADVDGNGATDVVLALNNGRVAVLWNGGLPALLSEPVSVQVASGLTAIGVADLDLDTRPDVVVTTADQQRLYVLRNTLTRQGMRGLENRDNYYAVGANPVALAVADFDGNQLPDVAVASQTARTVTVLLNQSN